MIWTIFRIIFISRNFFPNGNTAVNNLVNPCTCLCLKVTTQLSFKRGCTSLVSVLLSAEVSSDDEGLITRGSDKIVVIV